MGGKSRFSDESRFWSYVDKTDTCWNWTGAGHKTGHGRFKVNGKTELAHRYSWFLVTGRWSELDILHKCNNPRCVKKDHLYEGTDSDNRLDYGRMKRGES